METKGRFGFFLAALAAAAWASRAPAQDFRRGDADVNGRVDVQDALYILTPPFLPGLHFRCTNAVDADGDGSIQISDAIRILTVVFLGIAEIPPPGPFECGPVGEGFLDLGCADYPADLCADPPPPPLDPRFELRIEVPGGGLPGPHTPASAEVIAQLSSDVPVPWWSFGVAAEGECTVVAVTTAGTLAATVEDGGLVDGGFVRSEVIDPDRNGGRPGAVSAVILSLMGSAELPATGTAAANDVLKLTVRSHRDRECCVTCTLTFTDGLAGGGQPVENLVGLRTDPPSAARPSLTGATVFLGAGLEPFRRGDVGADGATNLSDAIRILDFLFTGEVDLTCEDAADVDDSGEIDITDPIRLLDFLFLGEVEIPPPLFDCGLDGDGDALDCRKSDYPA